MGDGVRRRKVLAVASGGGHWVQLRRIRPAFDELEVVYVGTDDIPDGDLDGRYYAVRNVTRRNRIAFALVIWQVLRIIARERPDVVVTTGAAPGFLALAGAKLFLRSRTIWIDSISSSETMTLSARLARPLADAWLVQWSHLARPEGPEYWGAVF
ncbi:UDP-N-acetylglucosamine--LPS N-acetylglucosamine transferase [Amaricoccus sp.]|uniref:UDP-N-acetylglucosamine--LPS N-acetylglucosamine transferase n=1 Tax=Amaricoccus sp. TaxID=1872485 RepID=UPI0025C5D563|nr:UDP-N-acetylglucosamine--LPS N-acetylglucosamine transferase [Amaricoccus sp.]